MPAEPAVVCEQHNLISMECRGPGYSCVGCCWFSLALEHCLRPPALACTTIWRVCHYHMTGLSPMEVVQTPTGVLTVHSCMPTVHICGGISTRLCWRGAERVNMCQRCAYLGQWLCGAAMLASCRTDTPWSLFGNRYHIGGVTGWWVADAFMSTRPAQLLSWGSLAFKG